MADLPTLDALSLFAGARQHTPKMQTGMKPRPRSRSHDTAASLIETLSSCLVSETCPFIKMCVCAAPVCLYWACTSNFAAPCRLLI
ncbi:hypothetical protein CGRA01v4_08560 [Colletotrichum graminicola]|nr:hypothetical protein CGRA01v4_08560 [Colletotrichum graminicola]